MSGINWVAACQTGQLPRLEAATLVGYELIGERWKEIQFERIILRRLCDGPYLLKKGTLYYCGNDSVYKRKKGDFITSLIESNFNKLIVHGLEWSDVFDFSFIEAKNCLDAVEIFGGEFLGRKKEQVTGRDLHLPDKQYRAF